MADPVIVPGAIWQPDPVSSTPIGDLHWVILHTIGLGTVDSAIGGRHYHIYVRANGEYIQIQDLNLRSAASVQGNPYSIAVVAEDKGPAFPTWSGGDVPDYTPQQKESIRFILEWILARYGLPVQYVQTSRLGELRGVAHHRFGIDGNYPSNVWPLWGRQSGGQSWSNTVGKWCTGDRRIQSGVQIVESIAQGDDMTPEQEQLLRDVNRKLDEWVLPLWQQLIRYRTSDSATLGFRIDAAGTKANPTAADAQAAKVNSAEAVRLAGLIREDIDNLHLEPAPVDLAAVANAVWDRRDSLRLTDTGVVE